MEISVDLFYQLQDPGLLFRLREPWVDALQPRIFVTSFDGEGEKNFEPFNELTKEAYLTSAAQSAKENV